MSVNFFESETKVERFYLDPEKKYWVDHKVGVSMEDMMKVSTPTDPEEAQKAVGAYHNLHSMLTASIVAWNLTDANGNVPPVTPENIRKLPMSVINRMAPIVQALSKETFLAERSETPSAPQSSTGDGMTTTPTI